LFWFLSVQDRGVADDCVCDVSFELVAHAGKLANRGANRFDTFGVFALPLRKLSVCLSGQASGANVGYAIDNAIHALFRTTAIKSFGSNRNSFLPTRTSGIKPSRTHLRKVASDTPKNFAACCVVSNSAGESTAIAVGGSAGS
jgi:hypothetical protein